MNRSVGCVSVLVLLLLSSCSPADQRQGPPDDLASARALWTSEGPAAYRFRFTRTCFCLPRSLEAVVSVRADTVYAVQEVTADGEPVTAPDRELHIQPMMTIEGLFEAIEQAQERGAAEVRVTYDAELGFPRDLYIDYEQEIADEEIHYMAEDVAPL